MLQRCYDAALEAHTAAKRYAKAGGPSLEIAIAAGIGADILARHLKRIARENPGVEFNLYPGTGREVLDMLKKGDVEIAIASGLEGCWDRLEGWQLGTERFSLGVAAGHPLAAEDVIELSALAGERLLSLPGASQVDRLMDEAGGDTITRREIATVDDIVPLVEAGLGVALLPDRVALPADLVRVDIAGLDLKATIHLHAVASRPRSAAAQALIKAVRGQGVSGTAASHHGHPAEQAAPAAA